MKTNKKGNIYPSTKVNIALNINIFMITASATVIFCMHITFLTQQNVITLLLHGELYVKYYLLRMHYNIFKSYYLIFHYY